MGGARPLRSMQCSALFGMVVRAYLRPKAWWERRRWCVVVRDRKRKKKKLFKRSGPAFALDLLSTNQVVLRSETPGEVPTAFRGPGASPHRLPDPEGACPLSIPRAGAIGEKQFCARYLPLSTSLQLSFLLLSFLLLLAAFRSRRRLSPFFGQPSLHCFVAEDVTSDPRWTTGKRFVDTRRCRRPRYSTPYRLPRLVCADEAADRPSSGPLQVGRIAFPTPPQMDHSRVVTTLAFDTIQELLWTGNDRVGRDGSPGAVRRAGRAS